MSAEPRACRLCGKVFTPTSKGQKFYCSWECSAFVRGEAKKERERNAYHIKKEAELKEHKKKVKSAKHKVKDLDTILKELNNYNKTHGTYISYGQWVAGVRAEGEKKC